MSRRIEKLLLFLLPLLRIVVENVLEAGRLFIGSNEPILLDTNKNQTYSTRVKMDTLIEYT